jgi:hypothetical protein
MARSLGLSEAPWEALEGLRKLVVEKNRQFFLRWRPVNAEYIYGRRKEPFGVLSYPPEMAEWERMVAELDGQIWQNAAAR